MTKLSMDGIEDEGEMAKRRKTLNPPPSEKNIGEGKTLNRSSPQNETREEKDVVTMQTDSLDCSICFHPLCPPIKQCKNGHVACPACWSKLKYKCHICKFRVQFRNIALEKVLEAAHAPCTYANLGCHKSVSYSERQVHTDTCEFAPSLCPIPGCVHKASSEWRAHFIKDHKDTIFFFNGVEYPDSYGNSWNIELEDEHLEEDFDCSTFLGPGKDVFLLLKEAIPNVGNALTLYYIDLPDLGRNYIECKLTVKGGPSLPSSLQSKSRVVSIKEWKRGKLNGSSLVIPSQFFMEKSLDVYVLLNKKKW